MPQISREPTDRQVLDAIVAAEPDGVTRSELAHRLTLSAATISTAIDRLGAAVDVNGKARPGKSGPPAKVLRVPDAGLVLALEIQQSQLRACTFNTRGEPRSDVHAVASNAEGNVRPTLQHLVDLARTLAGASGASPLVGVGIAVAGPVDPGAGGRDLRHGVIREDTMLRDWAGISPATELEQRLQWSCPFLVDNDATLSALAERRWGAARGRRDVIYVGWSRGIGAGLIIDGTIARGSSGLAGEIGHCTVVLKREDRDLINHPENGASLPACARCGRHCLESVAGVRAILDRAGLPQETTVDELLAAASAEDHLPAEAKVITRSIDRAAAYLGQVLGTCVNMLNPEAIVIGGEFPPSAAGLYRGYLMAKLNRHTISASFGDVDVVPSELGTTAALRGAATHVLVCELTDFLLRS